MKVLLTLLSVLFNIHLYAQNLTNSNAIFPKGNKVSNEYFTGNVWVNVLVPADTTFNTQIGSVTFEAGARTHWHTHGGGQILLVTDGTGYYQEKGKFIQIIRKGDMVKCLPDVEHWHGASIESPMTHLAVNTNTQKKIVTWLNPVTEEEYRGKKYQAKAPPTQSFGKEAFGPADGTTLRWLGMAGFLINSRSTTLMIDPLLGWFDMPVMIDFPIVAKDIPRLDAVLVTHSDNDHFSIPTCLALKPVTRAFHSTVYVDSLMKNQGLTSFGHGIGASFDIGKVRVKMTAADHGWQNAYPGTSERYFRNEDCAGFWIETPDGNIWATGDSRLMDEHLHMSAPDTILFDFSDSEWHFGLAGAVKLANAYPNTPLLLHHWGSVDAPDFPPFNGDPKKLYDLVVNPERIRVLAPGEPYTLKRLNKN